MSEPLKILLVEDSVLDAELLLTHLKRGGINVNHRRVYTESMLSEALDEEWDTIICDYQLPGMDAMGAVSIAKSKKPDIPLIIVSGSVGEEIAVEAMRSGASDYVMKRNLTRLMPAIERGIKERNFRLESRQIEDALKKREEELRQAQKLEAIGQLAGGIAHDFNNILATVLLQVDALTEVVESHKEKPFDEISSGLEQIRNASNRATNLTRQLLAFSRKQILQPKVLNLNSLISNLSQMLRPIIEENIHIRLSLSPEIENIKADPGHVEQIIMNLMVNSRDAMPDGGTIEIITRNATVEGEIAEKCNALAGAYVLLEIRDTGTGISPEAQKRMFEPFFTTKPVGKGTGMGLCTVYGIVKQNNGLIFIESELDKGTTFKVFFPRVGERAEELSPKPDMIKPVGGHETILFVEDEEKLREICCKVLEKNGYRVLTAADGVEALQRLKENPTKVDLIITDVVLPVMGGPELAKQARQISRETKILFQSGYTENTLLQNGISAGTVHFLEKPYRSSELLTKIRTILSEAG